MSGEDQDKKNDGLFWAAKKGDVEGVKQALKEGVCVDARNEVGQTALMLAVLVENRGHVNTLIEGGADIYASDKNGMTVDGYAWRWSQGLELLQTARASRRAAELDRKLDQACDSWSPSSASSQTTMAHQAPISRSRQRF